jgi:hypothetical protein
MRRTILTLLATVLLLQMVFVDTADARRKKKKKSAPPEEAPAETAPAADGENGAANGEAAPAEGESKSLSERLEDDGSEGALRTSRRLEFDERLVKGQAAKSGAVYLFKRIPRRLPGLVPLRRSYRRRIVEPVLGLTELKPARYSYEVEKEKKVKKRKETLEEIKEVEEAATEENGKNSKNKNGKNGKNGSDDLIEEIED